VITGYYEDIELGQKFRSGGRTITEAYVLQFAMLSGDWHPLHTDFEYSRQGPFGAPIAHGMLTLAVTTGLMTLSPESIQAFYGMDSVRFLRPVSFGDTIMVESEIVDRKPLKGPSGIIGVKVDVINQHKQIVLSMLMKFLVRSREHGTLAAQPNAQAVSAGVESP
jgi:3-hydroxybutyryl-CoA dehydratase